MASDFDFLSQRPVLRAPAVVNPAQWMYERLVGYVDDFEKELDAEHEIGARLVSFGQALTFHIEDLGYHGPDIITFEGKNEQGERVQLIQHVSQLSVLLVSVKKLGPEPSRIGFRLREARGDEGDSDP